MYLHYINIYQNSSFPYDFLFNLTLLFTFVLKLNRAGHSCNAILIKLCHYITYPSFTTITIISIEWFKNRVGLSHIILGIKNFGSAELPGTCLLACIILHQFILRINKFIKYFIIIYIIYIIDI